jgi:TatD DNase family protein
MFIDTHVHIPLMINMSSLQLSEEGRASIRLLLEESMKDHVNYLITIGTTYEDSMQNMIIAESFDNIYATIGIHPTEINDSIYTSIRSFQHILAREDSARHKIIGIGECGVDRYHKHASIAHQQDVFRMQIALALQHNLPIVIHSREAADETLHCLDEFRETNLRGIIHCFSYDASIAQEFIQRRFVLGLGGTITYPKNAALRDIAIQILPHEFVLETDAPFLTPQPWRGKKNHPQYIAYLAEYIGNLRGITAIEVGRQTMQTVRQIFKTFC